MKILNRRKVHPHPFIRFAGFLVLVLGILRVSAGLGIGGEPEVLELDPAKVIQSDFPGLGAVYQGFSFMPEHDYRGFDDRDRAQEFARVKDMGLKLARTWYRPDYSCPRGLQGDFDFDTPRMRAFVKWLEEMKKLGVDVALQAGWGFPHDTYYGHEGMDAERDPARYAEWVSASVKYLRETRGFTNIKYLVLFTEPNLTPWGPSTEPKDARAPEGFTMWEYYVKVVRAVHDQMVRDGTRGFVKFTAPNDSDRPPDYNDACHLRTATRDLNDVIDVYAAHAYLKPSQGYADWMKFNAMMMAEVRATGKPLWLDEYNVGSNWEEHLRDKPDHGNYLAQVVAAALNSGLQTSLLWALFDQQYVPPRADCPLGDSFFHGVLRWGLAKWPKDMIDNSNEPYPCYYAWAMMCRYLGGGHASVLATKSTEKVFLSAVRQMDGKLSLLVVNSGNEAVPISIRGTLPLRLNRHLYDPAAVHVTPDAFIPPADRKFQNVTDRLEDTLPPRAVAIYTELP